MQIRVTPSNVPIDYDLDWIKQNGYYYLADWMRLPVITMTNTLNRSFFISFQFFVRPDPVTQHFIGLPDSYSDHQQCLINFGNFGRLSLGDTPYQPEFIHYKLERAFQYVQGPQRLQVFQELYNMATREHEKMSALLHETKCQYMRMFIPVLWRGDETDSCDEELSFKSLKFIPNTRGLYEACDGSKLPIGPVYYMEFLMYTDPSMPEFINPSEEELDIAQKNGYIPFNTAYPIDYDSQGFNTRIRLWVKPNTQTNTYKRLICPIIPEDGPEVPNKRPDLDIYTRIVIESNDNLQQNQ